MHPDERPHTHICASPGCARRYVPADRRHCYNVTYCGFEDAVVPVGAFDLILTSPPFFDFEIYTTEHAGQSVDTCVCQPACPPV